MASGKTIQCHYCNEPQKDHNVYHNHLIKKHLYQEFPCKFYGCYLVRDKNNIPIKKVHNEECPLRNEETKREYSIRVWGNKR